MGYYYIKYTPRDGKTPNYYHNYKNHYNYKQKKQLKPFSTLAFKVVKTNLCPIAHMELFSTSAFTGFSS